MTHFVAKSALRVELLGARRARAGTARAADSKKILDALTSGLAELRVRTTACYCPVGSEPGQGLPEALLASGFAVLLPVVLADNDLDWASYTGAADLEPAGHGLTEPTGRRLGTAAIRDADALVVPAVAVGRDGSRLGRGGGSYDRALERVRAGTPIIALTYDNELLDSVPTEPHDRPVTVVVTPARGWMSVPDAAGVSGSG